MAGTEFTSFICSASFMNGTAKFEKLQAHQPNSGGFIHISPEINTYYPGH